MRQPLHITHIPQCYSFQVTALCHLPDNGEKGLKLSSYTDCRGDKKVPILTTLSMQHSTAVVLGSDLVMKMHLAKLIFNFHVKI